MYIYIYIKGCALKKYTTQRAQCSNPNKSE